MSADHIARISPMVRKVFESPSEGMCATIEIVGKRDAWAQVMKGTLNAAYPLETPPESHLRDILACLPGSIVTDWKAKNFVTVMFESATPSDVAKAVDQLFEKVFGVGDYAVDCRLENLS
ncbi:MAG TPA: hypothetical protein VMN03_01625 [Burkholderiales bacterium]|nr:hypothetical protein [Burkholderiales bacterium]